MPKQQSKKIEEEFFRVLERSKAYKSMEVFIRKILLEQWNDVLYSGIVNKMFNNYKRFFVRRKGKKQKIRKAVIDEVGSEEELKEAEKETLQADRFMVGEMAIKMLPFLLFLGNSVDNSMKSFSSYYGFNQEFRDYLRATSNIAGQTIIDQIPLPKPIKFRLSNRALKAKLAKRVDELVKGLNKTTKNTLTKQLSLGIKKGETKTQLLKRMQSKGVQVAKMRAKRIIATETEAIAEYMRYETALLNGVVTKTWETAGDESVCPTCSPLDGVSITMKGLFKSEIKNVKFEGLYPPVHPLCFLHHSVKITTDKSEKFINKIEVGDNVLTHKGRFRRVVKILHGTERYKGEAICIRFKGKVFGSSNTRNSVTITPEHPLLTSRGWVEAKNVDVYDFIFVISNRCLFCGEKIPFWKKHCNQNCKFKDQPEIRKKISASKKGEKNYMYGRGGKLNPMWKGGKIWYRGVDWKRAREKALKRDNYICQKCGITQGECRAKFKNQGLQVHHINPYRENQCNEAYNLISLCHKCHGEVENTKEKLILDSGGFEFIKVQVLGVIHKKDFEGEKRYNFSVDEDESYVASGVVVHNCRCSVSYDVTGNLASNFIKASGLDRIGELVQKAKQGNLYTPVRSINRGVVNPNAVWAGGESLVGKDKNIRNIFEEISNAREIEDKRLYEEAKEKLSLEGMVQLRSMLGLSPYIKLDN